MQKKICFILGTRPELIKMAPIIREAQQRQLDYFILHTGQHYSPEMDSVFFKDLGLPQPKYNLLVGSGLQGEQTGKMLAKIEEILFKEHPSIVLVQGDTNSVLAGALAAVKVHTPVGHIEAGLRSYDKSMPEEINRIIVDHIADYLFVPTQDSLLNLQKEGIEEEKIFVTGNSVVDSVLENIKIARQKSYILNDLHITAKDYILLTIHRAENTDEESTLRRLLGSLKKIADKYSMPLVWPLHPRTKSKLEQYDLLSQLEKIPGLIMTQPVGFFDFLNLENNARLVLTDSGGVQEEACILQVPCVTLRDNTERPETVKVGANSIAGTQSENIILCIDKMLSTDTHWNNPFGDGKSAQHILDNII